MGGHGYGGAGDAGSGFHGGGHFVHMRGLPFRATENDIANVSTVGKKGFLMPRVRMFLSSLFQTHLKFSSKWLIALIQLLTKVTALYVSFTKLSSKWAFIKVMSEVRLLKKSAKLYLILISLLFHFHKKCIGERTVVAIGTLILKLSEVCLSLTEDL